MPVLSLQEIDDSYLLVEYGSQVSIFDMYLKQEILTCTVPYSDEILH